MLYHKKKKFVLKDYVKNLQLTYNLIKKRDDLDFLDNWCWKHAYINITSNIKKNSHKWHKLYNTLQNGKRCFTSKVCILLYVYIYIRII